MQRWTARAGGSVAAGAWAVGLPLIGLTGVIPSDAPYFVAGLMGAILGCSTAVFALALPALDNRRRDRILRLAGAAAGVALAATSVLLALGAAGALGQTAPAWIPNAATIPLVALLGWVVVTSAIARRELGNVAFWLGVGVGISVTAAIATSALIPIATNATVPLTFAITVTLWVALPAWLLTVAWRR